MILRNNILKCFVRCALLCLTLLCVSGYALQPVSAEVEFEKRVYRIYKGQTKQLVLKSDDGSEPETRLVNYDEVRDYLIVDDTIYYVQKLSDSELDQLVEYFTEGDTQYSKYAYEIVLGNSGFLRSCPVSGGEVAELKTDPLIVADLYAYPEGMYCTVYGSADVYNKLVIE